MSSQATGLTEAMTVESFISVTNQFRIENESDWFVDNVHVTKDQQIFKEFTEFNEKRDQNC